MHKKFKTVVNIRLNAVLFKLQKLSKSSEYFVALLLLRNESFSFDMKLKRFPSISFSLYLLLNIILLLSMLLQLGLFTASYGININIFGMQTIFYFFVLKYFIGYCDCQN